MDGNYSNPLPGVPDVESPFFNELFDPSDPIYPIAQQLNTQGFAVLDFPDEQIETVALRLKIALRERYDWDAWQAGNGDMRIQDAWQFNDDVRRLATNAKVIEILERLYGRPAFPFQTLNFPVGTQQHFHTNSIHFSSRPERFMCGVWVALDDVGPDNGPLVYYPGSHRWPIYTREHIGATYSHEQGGHQGTFEPLWQRLVDLHKIEPAYFYAKKGQALIWAANLIHGGAFHKDRARTRWSQVTHYYFKDCVYYTPLTSNEPAGDVFVRNPQDIRTRDVMLSSYHGKPIEIAPIAPIEGGPQALPADFDPARYMLLNPDVAAGEMDARTHYTRYGHAEGRRFK